MVFLRTGELKTIVTHISPTATCQMAMRWESSISTRGRGLDLTSGMIMEQTRWLRIKDGVKQPVMVEVYQVD